MVPRLFLRLSAKSISSMLAPFLEHQLFYASIILEVLLLPLYQPLYHHVGMGGIALGLKGLTVVGGCGGMVGS